MDTIKKYGRNLFNNKFLRSLIPIIFFIALWLFMFLHSKILDAGFNYFVDDHQIYLFHNESATFQTIVIDPIAALFSSTPGVRFRPVSDILLRFFSHAYGLDATVWYESSMIIAIFTSIIFYLLGKKLSFNTTESICFALLIVLGQQATTYARFGTQETTSTLFMALAFLCAALSLNKNKAKARLFDGLSLFFAILAALNKEAFLLMLPAFACFKVWLYAKDNNIPLIKSFFHNKFSVIILACVFIACIGYIKLAGITGPGYAGIDKDTFSKHNLYTLFKSLVFDTSFGIALVLNVVLIIYRFISKKNNKLNTLDWGMYLVSFLIITPQLLLYSKSGLVAHYLFPCVIGTTLLTIYPLMQIRKISSKSYLLLLLLVLFGIYNNFVLSATYFTNLSLKLTDVQAMVKDTQKCISNDKNILIFGDPYMHYESLYGYKKVVIDDIYKLNKDNYILATYGSEATDIKTDIFKAEEQKWLYMDPVFLENLYNNNSVLNFDDTRLQSSKAIVIFDHRKFEKDFNAFTSKWFDQKNYEYKYYPNTGSGLYCKK